MPESMVAPVWDQSQFLEQPIQSGKIYPTLYLTKEQFESVSLPANARRFVIIRDLRDTLISGYFSIKHSHEDTDEYIVSIRSKLESLPFEDGLMWLMGEWLYLNAEIQTSWLLAKEPIIRYEDLLSRDLEILADVLLDQCQLPIPRENFEEIVADCRFESLTGGRQRGEENVAAHERKGIVGDWKNYFTDRVREAFKMRYGGLLVAAGYERDLKWI